MTISSTLFSQILNVKGNISSSTSPVKNSVVTFIDQQDTLKQYSAVSDSNGHFQLSVETNVTPTPSNVPQSIKLEQNYPNPFSSSTAISYQLNKQLGVSIKIYDILGREVRALTVGSQIMGTHGILWDGKDNVGKKVTAGIYFYQLRAGNETHVKKMVFSGGSATVNLTALSGMSANTKESRIADVAKIARGTFTVRITNAAYTRPQIVSTQIPNVVLQQDTTLNFEVQGQIMAYSLCYAKQDSLMPYGNGWWIDWDIFLDNITGSNSKDITFHWMYDDENPAWSPNGKYIAFHRVANQVNNVYLYDAETDTVSCLLAPDTGDVGLVGWAPNGQLMYVTGPLGIQMPPYMMNVDGSNKRRIFAIPLFFYPDSYTILHGDLHHIYRSNIDGTFDELLIDLTTVGKNYVHCADFNPNTNDLLILADPVAQITNLLLKYNIDAKTIDTISIADSGWMYVGYPKYSNDFQKIAVAEVNYTDNVKLTTRISLIENGNKTTLVEFRGHNADGTSVSIDMAPFAFSPDNEYLAFSKNIYQPGIMVWWISYLTVIDLATRQTTVIDNGIRPEWNPKKPH